MTRGSLSVDDRVAPAVRDFGAAAGYDEGWFTHVRPKAHGDHMDDARIQPGASWHDQQDRPEQILLYAQARQHNDAGSSSRWIYRAPLAGHVGRWSKRQLRQVMEHHFRHMWMIYISAVNRFSTYVRTIIQ